MTPSPTSRLPGLYDLAVGERLARVREAAALDDAALQAFTPQGGLTPDLGDRMIENVVGVYNLPLGIAVNFLVNGREVLVPMAIEEPSVVAGASFMAKLAREGGGFLAEAASRR
jgi:hydroxymethylglutaryl-CoA reductase